MTIFTPTYNRAATLPRLFASLVAQRTEDFEWLVWDDGSSDESPSLLAGFAAEAAFPVRVFRGKNGGKHRAINRAVVEARGESFFIVDSDDWIEHGAVAAISDAWGRLREDPSICGLVGYRADADGRLISDSFPSGLETSDQMELRYGYGVRGDKAEVFKTSILRDFPFPEIEGERFINEAVVWNRMASHYQLKLLPMALYGCEYLPGGLSDRSLELRIANPQGSLLYYGELLGYSLPAGARFRAGANYLRIALHARMSIRELWVRLAGSPLVMAVSLTLGLALWIHDLLRNKRK